MPSYTRRNTDASLVERRLRSHFVLPHEWFAALYEHYPASWAATAGEERGEGGVPVHDPLRCRDSHMAWESTKEHCVYKT